MAQEDSKNIKDFQNEFQIADSDMLKAILANDINISKNGFVNSNDFQLLINYFQNNNETQVIPEKLPISAHHSFQNNRVNIYQNDAIEFLEALESESVDLIVTDPAYSGMNQKLKLGRGKIIGVYKNAGEEGAKWFDEFHDSVDNYQKFLKECFRVLKKDRHIYIMFDSYSMLTLAPLVREVFAVKNILCWDKMHIGLGHYFRRRHEFILFASKGKRSLNSKSIPDVWKVKRVTSLKYPTQKPTEIFEIMLHGSAEKDYVVCDPFLGSGSSAIAAIKFNCKFLGCDSALKSIDISKERIEHYLQNNSDILQNRSLIGDDDLLIKLLYNGKPE